MISFYYGESSLALFTTETWFPKYFEYTYGIDAPKHIKTLVEKGYAVIETAFDSLDHLNATMKKNILKSQGITGLSKMKAADLDQALHDNFSERRISKSLFNSWLQIDFKGGRNTGTIPGHYRPSSKEKSLIK